MSRPSKQKLQEFAGSPEFDLFLDALERDVYMTLAEATRFWPLLEFRDHRHRRKVVGGILVELSRGSCLDPEGDQFFSLPTVRRSWGTVLPSVAVPALQLPNCIKNGPFHTRTASSISDSAELDSLCKSLRTRIRGCAEIRWVRVFAVTVQQLHLNQDRYWRFGSDRGCYSDAAFTFSAGALLPYLTEENAWSKVTIGPDALIEILSDSDFLRSPNAVLLLSDIRRKMMAERSVSEWQLNLGDWESKNREPIMIRTDAPHVFCSEQSETNHDQPNDLRIVFAGAGKPAMLKQIFDSKGIMDEQTRIEFW